MSIIESNIKTTIKPSINSQNYFNKNNLRSSCKIAFTFSMIFLPFGKSQKIPLTRMLTKPAISMQISSIPQLKPINNEDNSRWNKLQDHNTNRYYYTLSSHYLLDRDNIREKNDSSNLFTDPFTITSLLDKHNPDANVLVLTGTTASQDGYIYLDKQNTDNEDYLKTKCDNLRDDSDYEFLYNYQSDQKNVIVVDIDTYQQNNKLSDVSESESVGCLKRIMSDKRQGSVSSIIFAWAKSEQTNSLLDAIQSIDCDNQKSQLIDDENFNEHEFKIEDNNDKISKIQQIYDLSNKEKDLIKREQKISMREEATKKRYKETLRREKQAAFNLDQVELTNTNNDLNEITIKPENIKRATTLDLRINQILDRQIKVQNREEKLVKKEEKITKIELDTILTELENIKKIQESL